MVRYVMLGGLGQRDIEIAAVPVDEMPDAGFNRDAGQEIDALRQRRDIGPGLQHFAWLHRQVIALRLDADRRFQAVDKRQQLHRLTAADIVKRIAHRRLSSLPNGRRTQTQTHDTFDNVVYISEVPGHQAIVVNINRLAQQNRLGELEQCHVRTTPGAIHGKEAQAGNRNVIQM